MHQPCLTLDKYLESSHIYFTSGSTFVFLPGNHSLQSSINLRRLSNITLKGIEDESSTTIICKSHYTIVGQSVTNLSIEWLTFDLAEKQYHATALLLFKSHEVVISDCIFRGGITTNTTARALYSMYSSITILRSLFEGNRASRGENEDTETDSGGAIYIAKNSMITLIHNRFSSNSAAFSGGALACETCTLIMEGNNTFTNNSLVYQHYDTGRRAVYSGGGAITVRHGSLITSGTTIFAYNEANDGGGIHLFDSAALFGGHTILFLHNSALNGGGMSAKGSSFETNATFLEFIDNYAEELGGGLYLRHLTWQNTINISGNFTHNRAECGGAISVAGQDTYLTGTTMSGNTGSAVCISEGFLTFVGTTIIHHNIGTTGGGINSKNAIIRFQGSTSFDSNYALAGGAINSIQGKLSFEHRNVLFKGNRADSNGGAIYAIGSTINLTVTSLNLVSNSAMNGGAMYLSAVAILMLLPLGSTLHTYNNSATEYGGAIFIEDNPTIEQCSFTANANSSELNSDQFLSLPQCTLGPSLDRRHMIYTHHDVAMRDGNFLYGGLLDKCKPSGWTSNRQYTEYDYLMEFITIDGLQDTTTRNVSSDAYALYFCNTSSSSNREYDHYLRSKRVKVFRGERLSVHLVTFAQGGIITSSRVTAVSQSSRLGAQQNIQTLPEGCSVLTYTLYSAKTNDQLILYPDGPCRDSGLAKLAINVTFLPCPRGFTQSGEVCVCEERLRAYNVDCVINESIQIIKNNGSNFWMSTLQTQNGSYGGLILYNKMPSRVLQNTSCCSHSGRLECSV